MKHTEFNLLTGRGGGGGVDDAKVFILNTLYRHLEGRQIHARTLFADLKKHKKTQKVSFFSAFNTTQPHIFSKQTCLIF